MALVGAEVSLAADATRESKDLSISDRAGSRIPPVAWALGGIVVIAIVARILFILGWTWAAPLHGDPLFFHQSARASPGQRLCRSLLGQGPLVPRQNIRRLSASYWPDSISSTFDLLMRTG